jgi:hypothetical protein
VCPWRRRQQIERQGSLVRDLDDLSAGLHGARAILLGHGLAGGRRGGSVIAATTPGPWTLKELAAHGVNYRKYVSPDLDHLLPGDQFRLLAASMHFPRQLASRVTLQPQGPGAYDVVWGVDTIRILVLREMPEAEQNVVWNLFSGDQKRIATAFQRLKPRLQSYSSLVNELLEYYGLEGIAMPYTMEEFEREVAEKVLKKLTPQQRLKGLSPEDRLEGLSPEELLSHLTVAEIESYLKKQKAAQEKTSPDLPKTPSS